MRWIFDDRKWLRFLHIALLILGFTVIFHCLRKHDWGEPLDFAFVCLAIANIAHIVGKHLPEGEA